MLAEGIEALREYTCEPDPVVRRNLFSRKSGEKEEEKKKFGGTESAWVLQHGDKPAKVLQSTAGALSTQLGARLADLQEEITRHPALRFLGTPFFAVFSVSPPMVFKHRVPQRRRKMPSDINSSGQVWKRGRRALRQSPRLHPAWPEFSNCRSWSD